MGAWGDGSDSTLAILSGKTANNPHYITMSVCLPVFFLFNTLPVIFNSKLNIFN